VVGSNTWMIESEFRDSKVTRWFTGTNIIQHSVVIKDGSESTSTRVTNPLMETLVVRCVRPISWGLIWRQAFAGRLFVQGQSSNMKVTRYFRPATSGRSPALCIPAGQSKQKCSETVLAFRKASNWSPRTTNLFSSTRFIVQRMCWVGIFL
jgi:hypothetical protein